MQLTRKENFSPLYYEKLGHTNIFCGSEKKIKYFQNSEINMIPVLN